MPEAKPDAAAREPPPKADKGAASSFANPLVVAILAAAVAAAGNAMVALVNGQQTRRVEEVRAEASRILEMIKTGDPDTAAENLRFLAESGLISDPERREAIQTFLAARSPGQGPALPTAAGRDVAQSTRDLPQDDRLRAMSAGVGQLLAADGVQCTAFLVTPDWILTPDFCLRGEAGVRFRLAEGADATTPAASWEVDETPLETISLGTLAVILLGFETAPGAAIPAMRLAETPPQVGDVVASLFFREGQGQLAVRDRSCVIVRVTETEFAQPCTMGAGAAGAPILSEDGSTVVGVHVRREPGESGTIYWALRADQIAARSSLLAGAGYMAK
jgi:V8-like Glu-specific endopeptidase